MHRLHWMATDMMTRVHLLQLKHEWSPGAESHRSMKALAVSILDLKYCRTVSKESSWSWSCSEVSWTDLKLEFADDQLDYRIAGPNSRRAATLHSTGGNINKNQWQTSSVFRTILPAPVYPTDLSFSPSRNRFFAAPRKEKEVLEEQEP